MRLSVVSVLGLVVAGCAPPVPLTDRSGVRVVTAAEVGACTPLRVITTTTGVFSTVGSEKAMELARNESLAAARAAGADTLVYENGAPGSGDLFVKATAYRC